VAIQQLEQFDQGQGRLSFSVFIARERIDAAAKEFGGLPLVKVEFSTNLGDVVGIDVGGIT